jgi:DNA-binding transcriptional ArsR family regulator
MVKSSARQLDRVFHALSDGTRRAILEDLSTREKTVSQLARRHPMSLAAVSKHLRVLEDARLVGRRKEGSFRILCLKGEALLAAAQWMEEYRKFWNPRLHALKSLLERGRS